jgi:hypothetical protein
MWDSTYSCYCRCVGGEVGCRMRIAFFLVDCGGAVSKVSGVMVLYFSHSLSKLFSDTFILYSTVIFLVLDPTDRPLGQLPFFP